MVGVVALVFICVCAALWGIAEEDMAQQLEGALDFRNPQFVFSCSKDRPLGPPCHCHAGVS